jgi:hypothetical protein
LDCFSVQDGTWDRVPPWEHRVHRLRLVRISWVFFRSRMVPGAASRLGNTSSKDCVWWEFLGLFFDPGWHLGPRAALGIPRPETAFGGNFFDVFFGAGWYVGPRAALGTPRPETVFGGNILDCFSFQDGTWDREPPWEHRVHRLRLVGISWIVFRSRMVPGAASRLGNTASRDCAW